MELRHLRYFLAVAETGNVTKAAQQFFVAQSAMSSQIARLETELGSALFLRSRQGMRLTPAGEVLRPLAVEILANVERAREQMDALRGLVRGRLRVGTVQVSPASLDTVGLLARFNRQHPDVELLVQTGPSADLATAVATGELDIALVALDMSEIPGSLDVRRLCNEPLVGVVAMSECRHSDRAAIAVEDLVELGPFIHYREGSGLRRAVTAAFDRAGVEVTGRFQLDQVSDMIRLAARGTGVTIVPISALPPPANAIGQTEYRALHLIDPQAVHSISVVTRGSPSPAADRFLSLLEIQIGST